MASLAPRRVLRAQAGCTSARARSTCQARAPAHPGASLQEELDAEMDAYFLKGDPKTAHSRLNEDLDDYFKQKPAAAAPAAAPPAEPVAVAEGEGAKQ